MAILEFFTWLEGETIHLAIYSTSLDMRWWVQEIQHGSHSGFPKGWQVGISGNFWKQKTLVSNSPRISRKQLHSLFFCQTTWCFLKACYDVWPIICFFFNQADQNRAMLVWIKKWHLKELWNGSSSATELLALEVGKTLGGISNSDPTTLSSGHYSSVCISPVTGNLLPMMEYTPYFGSL